MRTSFSILVVALVLVASAGAQAPSEGAPGEAVFLVSGRGYGHGVGLSQYGAYGMARAGKTYDQILRYYYSGTTLGPAPTKQLRVLLAEGRSAITLSSSAPFTAKDSAGRVFKLPAGGLALAPRLSLPAAALATTDGATTAKPKTQAPIRAKPPLLFRAGKAPLSLDGRAYRGQLEVSRAGGVLRAINVVDLESYVQGVVAGEMPDTWPAEALKAQAVAARSYALARRVQGKPFDLYSDPRSQLYLGVAGEKPSTTAAVTATAGRVVLYGGQVAATMYFSSSGGRTASAADVFGTPIPYLVSRPDPWDAGSPYNHWGPFLFGSRTLQAKLGADARVVDATTVTTPSGRLRSLVLQTTSGSETVPATLVRTALGLRSTWLEVGVLRLDRPTTSPVVYASPVRLTGVARGIGPVFLSSSPDARAWTKVGPVNPAPDGTVSIPVKPARTMRYRIGIEGASAPALLVEVAPRVQLAVSVQPGTLAGSVRPALAGSSVTIERRKGTSWTPVRQASADASGSFSTQLKLVPGFYRARTPESSAFAAGASTPIQVDG